MLLGDLYIGGPIAVRLLLAEQACAQSVFCLTSRLGSCGDPLASASIGYMGGKDGFF
jgi:hypothetical protein